jgi:hemerythrin
MLVWHSDFNISPTIDAQHKKLIDTVNLLESVISGTSLHKSDINIVMMDLIVYAKEHFKDEEALMTKIGYPGLAEHRSIHEKFLKKLLSLYQERASGKDVKKDMYVWLSIWFVDHVKKVDLQYRDWMISHALQYT